MFLHRHSGETDLLIGTPVSNRRLPEFHGLVGLFVNTLAIRADLDEAADFLAVLERMRDTVLAAHAHQDLPFEQVIAQMAPPRSEQVAPLVQAVFAMPTVPRGGRLAEGLTWAALEGQGPQARFDLSLALERTPEGLRGQFDYGADIFDAATAERLARRLETLLAGLGDDGLWAAVGSAAAERGRPHAGLACARRAAADGGTAGLAGRTGQRPPGGPGAGRDRLWRLAGAGRARAPPQSAPPGCPSGGG